MSTAIATLTSKLAAKFDMGDGSNGERIRFKHYRNDGDGTVTRYGYVMHGSNGKKRFEHVIVAERALGKPLPAGAEVHHVNENKADNSPSNLVICPNKVYHKMLHVRASALEACGNANHRKCPFCKRYDDPSEMIHNRSSRYYYHASCKTKYNHSRRAA